MTYEQSLRVTTELIKRGILSQQAGRLMIYLQQHNRFCEAMRTHDGEIGIVWRERWWTPLEFNAVAADAYPPTSDDIVASIRAMAAIPAPEPDAAPESAPAPAPDPDPAPPAPETPEAEAQLEQIHQAASQRPGGAGALTWGLALLIAVFAAIAALGFWQVAQMIWSR